MTDEELKKVDRNDLQDEIISILFKYLLNENKSYEKALKHLKFVEWKVKEDDHCSINN